MTEKNWVRHKLKAMLSPCRKSAAKRGIPFDLDWRQLEEVLDRQGMQCAVTGLPFTISNRDSHGRGPWLPSIDRIDSDGGYTADNVRIVCSVVNMALNSFGDDVFMRMVDAAQQKLSKRMDMRSDLYAENVWQAKRIGELEQEVRDLQVQVAELVRPYADKLDRAVQSPPGLI